MNNFAFPVHPTRMFSVNGWKPGNLKRSHADIERTWKQHTETLRHNICDMITSWFEFLEKENIQTDGGDAEVKRGNQDGALHYF